MTTGDVPPSVQVPGFGESWVRLAEGLCSGKSVSAVADEIGMDRSHARRLMLDPRFRRGLETLQSAWSVRREFDHDAAHDMLAEAYAAAEAPSDQIRAAEALIRLHGLDKQKPPLVPNEQGELVVDYEAMGDEELKRIARRGRAVIQR